MTWSWYAVYVLIGYLSGIWAGWWAWGAPARRFRREMQTNLVEMSRLAAEIRKIEQERDSRVLRELDELAARLGLGRS